jgi:uncharacterized protein YebE (UPF0316 family)
MTLILLCLKIFFVRIIDVSLGTIRTIITIKGNSIVASIIGFFEVLVWFLVVKEALNTTQSGIIIAISYSLGFATGTYIGSVLSDIFINGIYGVQVITSNKELLNYLKDSKYAVSIIDIYGAYEMKRKYMLIIEVSKKKVNNLLRIIKKYDSKAFTVINETKYVMNGYLK